MPDSQLQPSDRIALPTESQTAEPLSEVLAALLPTRPLPVRAALGFIQCHGALAELRAAQLASVWMQAGDPDGAAYLIEVCDAVEELQRTEREPGDALH